MPLEIPAPSLQTFCGPFLSLRGAGRARDTPADRCLPNWVGLHLLITRASHRRLQREPHFPSGHMGRAHGLRRSRGEVE